VVYVTLKRIFSTGAKKHLSHLSVQEDGSVVRTQDLTDKTGQDIKENVHEAKSKEKATKKSRRKEEACISHKILKDASLNQKVVGSKLSTVSNVHGLKQQNAVAGTSTRAVSRGSSLEDATSEELLAKVALTGALPMTADKSKTKEAIGRSIDECPSRHSGCPFQSIGK